MASTWVSIQLDQLVTQPPTVGDQRDWRCALCRATTIPGANQTGDEQIRMHLQRHHGAVIEEATATTSARVRRALQAQGWTPPRNDRPTPGQPEGNEHPPPSRADRRG